MCNIETKRSIKKFIAAAVKPYVGKKNRTLSVILNYHSIHPAHKFATRPEDFEQQMKYLKSNFNVVPLLDFYESRKITRDLHNKLAMVTFDDGYEDNYEYAFPILNRLGIKATIFLTTGFITGEIDITKEHIPYRGLRPLTWEHILQMRQAGISFGAHSHTHQVLTNISPDRARQEITKSKSILEDKLMEPVRIFAYPYGQRRTFNSSIVNLLKEAGFDAACSTIWGSDNTNTNIFALHRIRIDAGDTIEDFENKINGHWDFVRLFQTIRC